MVITTIKYSKTMLYNKVKDYILTLLSLYVFWIIAFVIQKPLFMLFNPIDNLVFSDWINVIIHGFKLDFCFSAYLLFIPIVFLIVRVFVRYNIKKTLFVYNLVLQIIITIIFAIDCVLYSYWGFRIDSTLIFYLRDFGESLNSVTFKDLLMFLLISAIYFSFVFFFYKYTIQKILSINPSKSTTTPLSHKTLHKIINLLVLIIFIPVFAICSRGGFSTATANVGMVYYTDNQKLNLAAVNPLFNLMYSLTKNEDFGSKYQFYNANFAYQEFNKLFSNTPLDSLTTQSNVSKNSLNNSTTPLGTSSYLSTQRPNVLIIMLESFSARLVGSLDGHLANYEGKEVTPTLNSLKDNSIIFKQGYSNGMRTDRGVVAILSGFLSQPDMSIIKYPEKTAKLPSIAKSLSKEGYSCEMIYGGDINFANMRSFFYGTGYKNIIDYKSFDVKDRLSKWGVNDAIMFSYLGNRLKSYPKNKPFFTTFLTLSSHEPFDVDMHRFKDPYVNSVAYTDSCLGVFLNDLKHSDVWKNTLIVLVGDHASVCPENTSPQNTDYYHIPIIFTGGAITKSLVVEKFMNQTDISKTLLSMLGLDASEFVYSKNILSPNSPNFAFFVYTNGFGFLDNSGVTFFDNEANKSIIGFDKVREMKGKVILQTLYKNISKL